MVPCLSRNKMLSDNLRMILQDCSDEGKEMVVLNGQIYLWAYSEDSLVQSLVQCSFSSIPMIYQKVSIDGTRPILI